MIRRAFATGRPGAPLPRRGTDACPPPPSPTARDHGRARIRRIRICRVTSNASRKPEAPPDPIAPRKLSPSTTGSSGRRFKSC
jgi:hypothetical protein